MMRHNVLLICVDHWPGPLIGTMGHDYILTPTLNRIADNGTVFSRAYSATPTCIPARRAIMTGTTAQTHGDRVFNECLEMDPGLFTLPQTFRDAGYHAYAVGKLHVYPQRNRIGFDDVLLNEEGRHHLGNVRDDYECFLLDQGYAGQEFGHAMGTNEYCTRPWHLPEYCHSTHWTVRQMCRVIQRRDPTRPAFWYCSFSAPHPPVTPPGDYLDMYRDVGVDEPFVGGWALDSNTLPYALKLHADKRSFLDPVETRLARMGFYAQCTYIDHQIRLLIGTLREEGLLDNTILMFIGDHGDMLGNHNLWAKPTMYEWAVRVPMFLVPTAGCDRVATQYCDDRLAALRDVMPTLLDLCDIPIPSTVEGYSLLSEHRRSTLYCEHWEDERAMRMIRSEQFKLIWYPVGNRLQLFDMDADPDEVFNLANNPEWADVRDHLVALLLEELYGNDNRWIASGRLIGEPDREFNPLPHRGLTGQRGWR